MCTLVINATDREAFYFEIIQAVFLTFSFASLCYEFKKLFYRNRNKLRLIN